MSKECKRFRELFSDAYDGILLSTDKEKFHTHLSECLDCKKEYDSYYNTLTKLDEVGFIQPSSDLINRVKDGYSKGVGQSSHNVISIWKSNIYKPASIAASFIIIFLLSVIFLGRGKVDPLSVLSENGYKKVGDIWVSAKDYADIKHNDLVFYNGKFQKNDSTFTDSVLERNNYVYYNGQWRTQDDALMQKYLSSGYILYNNKWYSEEALTEDILNSNNLVLLDGKYIDKDFYTKVKEGYIYQDGDFKPLNSIVDNNKTPTDEGKELVLYNGWWMSPELKEKIENGLVYVDGDWLTKEELTSKLLSENHLVYNGKHLLTEELAEKVSSKRVVSIHSTNASSTPVGKSLNGLIIGAELATGDISVFPLYTHDNSNLSGFLKTDVLDISSIQVGRDLEIRELENPAVNMISIKNLSSNLIFIPTGTILEGGKQDRIVSEDILIPANSTQNIKVYCCENKRWGIEQKFRVSSVISPYNLYENIATEEGQGIIWEYVSNLSNQLKIKTQTNSLADICEKSGKMKYSKNASSLLDKLSKLKNNVIGVAICSEGKIVRIDLYSNNMLFKQNIGKMISSVDFALSIGKKKGDSLNKAYPPALIAAVKQTIESMGMIIPEKTTKENNINYTYTGSNNFFAFASTITNGTVHISIIPEHPDLAKLGLTGKNKNILNNPNQSHIIKAILSEFHKTMKTGSLEERLTAVKEIADYRHPYLINAAGRYLTTDKSSEVRIQIAQVIGLFGDTNSLKYLKKGLAQLSDDNELIEIINSMVKLNNTKAIESLFKFAISCSSKDVGIKALGSIVYITAGNDNPKTMKFTIKKLLDIVEYIEKLRNDVDHKESLSSNNKEDKELLLLLKRRAKLVTHLYDTSLTGLSVLAGKKFLNGNMARAWWKLEGKDFLNKKINSSKK